MPEANKKQYYVQFEGAKQGVVVDADKYEANKDRLYKEHPNATVIETYDYDGNDENLNPESSSFIVQFEGASQAVNVPYDAFMKKKEQLFKEHPNARISVSRAESDDYWGQRASQSIADIDAFDTDENRGGFMREYEKQSDELKRQAISGSVARNANSADNPLANFITQNAKQYEQLKNERKVLADSYFNNPKVQQQMQSSKNIADKQREFYMDKVDSSSGADKRDYRRAAQIQKDIADLYSAVTRYGEKDQNGFREYFKGMGDSFNDVDFWTMGITDTAKRFDVSGIQRKLQKAAQEGKLTDATQIDKLITPSEKELLVSFYQLNAAQANTAQGISHAYNAGKSAADSLGFMAQFMVSGGIGKLAGSALMKSANTVAQWLGRAIAGNGAMAKGVENELAKIALTDLAEPIAQAVFHTVTQPAATLNAISQQMTEINDEGQMQSVGTAIKRGIADTLIENWSESIGTASEETAKLLNLSEKIGKSSLSKTDLYRWARWLNNTKADELIRQAGFNGLISEMGEEWIGNAARVGIGLMSKEDFRQWGGDLLAGKKAYPDKDERKAARKEAIANQLEMAASFALMTGINTAVSGYGAIKQAKLYNDAVDKEKEILARAGASEEEIKDIFNTKYDTSADIAKKFAPWAMKIYENATSDEQAIEDYAQTLRFVQTANSQVIADEISRLQKEQDRSNADAELLNLTGNKGYSHVVPGSENETVRTITDEKGRRAFLQEESNGTHTVRYDDGGVGFLTDEAIQSGVENNGWIDSGEVSKEEYLDNYVAEKKSAAENARMEQELAQKIDAVRRAAPPQSEINIGTAEAPVTGIVVQWTSDGCIVQSTEDNSTQLYSVEQIAEKLGMSTAVKTDAELNKEMADEEIANEELRRKQNQHSGLVFDFNGNRYILDRVYDIKNNEENGEKTATISASQLTEDGLPDLPEDIDIPVKVILDAISSNAPVLSDKELAQAAVQNFNENNEAQAEADALAEEDNTPRDFHGNPLPLTPDGEVDQKTLWNKDPEAWTVWNDNNPDRIVDSRVYAQGRLDFIDGELKRLDKAIQKETRTTGDFDKIKQLNTQIRDLEKRRNVIATIMDNYAKMDAAQKGAEQAQAAAQKEEERRRTAELNEPQNITQLAVRMLQEVKAHSLNRDSFKKELGWGNKELAQFFPWWAKKGKGMSLDALAERMVERDSEYGYVPMVGDAEQKDTQAAKNALIDVMQTISRPGEVRDLVINENKAYEEALKDAEEAAIEAEVMSRYGLTIDEYNALSDEERAALDSEKKNSVPDNTMDTGETLTSEQNDTATLQNTVSKSKDTETQENTNSQEENPSEVNMSQEQLIEQSISEIHDKLVDMLQQTDGNQELLDYATEEEQRELASLWDEFNEKNDFYGEEFTRMQPLISKAGKKEKEVLKKQLKEIEDAKDIVAEGMLDYYNKLADKYGINEDTETLDEATAEENPAEDIGFAKKEDGIEEARQEVDTNPSEAQKKAGNYKMGHVKIDGYDFTMENPKGSVRKGVDENGNAWEVTMNNDYGYIRGTKGVDGDHIDMFLSDNPEQGNVYVVDQIKTKRKTVKTISDEALHSIWGRLSELVGNDRLKYDKLNEALYYALPESREVGKTQPIIDLIDIAESMKGDGGLADEILKNVSEKSTESSTKVFDEHKVMYGFNSVDEAKAAYLSNYGEGWQGLGAITPVSKEEFKKWIESSTRKTKPFAEYASVEPLREDIPVSVPEVERANGTVKKETAKPENAEQSAPESGSNGQYGANNKLVTNERYEELKKRMIAKMNQLNLGFDPETLAIGCEMAAYHIEAGARKFVDYAERMINDLGEAIKPYLKAFYNGARDLPGMEDYAKDMDSYDVVSATEVNTIGLKNTQEYNEGDLVIYKGKSMKVVGVHPKTLDLEYNPTGFLPVTSMGVPSTDVTKFVSFHQEDISEETAIEPEVSTNTVSETENVVESVPLGTIDTSTHEKTGKKQWIVKPSARVSEDEFAELKKSAKDNGGFWYGKKKGFIFYDEESANKFNNSNTKEYAETTDEQTASDSAAIVREAGFIAEEAGAIAESSAESSESKIAESLNKVDGAIDAINSQLSILGKYDSRSDFKNAAIELGRSIAIDLGYESSAAEVSANTWGNQYDVTISIPVAKKLKIDVVLSAGGTGESVSTAKDITVLLRHQTKNQLWGTLSIPYGSPYANILGTVRDVAAGYLPAQPSSDNLAEAATIISQNNEKKKENSVPLNGNDLLGDLFSTMTEDEPQSEPDIEPSTEPKAKRPDEINGFKIGDTVLFKRPGETNQTEVKLVGFEDGRPVIDSFGANWISEITDWENIEKYVEPTNTDNNGLQGTDAIRSEGSSDSSGYGREDSRGQGEDGSRAGQESGGSDRGREGQGSGQSRTVRPRLSNSVKLNTNNNRAERGTDYAPTSIKARFNANVEAIKLMKQLVEREQKASKADMATLRQFSGWGGLGTYFNNEYSPEYKQLKDLLTDEEMQDARLSINSAYYTPAPIIDGLWDIAKRMGFEGGKVLEGSAGIGNIIGLMPKGMSENSEITAVEIDSITGNILKLLYPDATVHIKGFQDVKLANNSVDLAITNVPFVTGLHVYDSAEKDLSNKFENIHDFCIAKNVRKLKEGGIGIFITSRGTLDKSHKLRNWVVNEGNSDFVGAFRLNNKTFGETPVTSDIIVIRKRVNAKQSAEAIDVSGTTIVRTGEYEDKNSGRWNRSTYEYDYDMKPVAMEYNTYFVENPQFMAGEMKFGYEMGDTFRPGSSGLFPKDGIDQQKLLNKWIKTLKNTGEAARSEEPTQVIGTQDTTAKEGQIIVNAKNEICVSRNGKAVPIGANDNKVKGYSKVQCVKDYDALKSAVDAVIEYQQKNESDEGLAALLGKLNKAYDLFTKRYGYLNKNTSISFLRNNDVDFASIAALEDYRETEDFNGKKKEEVKKTDIFTKRIIGYKSEPTPQTAKDGVIVSIQQFGRIDMPYIASKLGRSEDSIGQEILEQGLAFVDPASGMYVPSYEYLSGNVRTKLDYAMSQNEDGKYDRNIEELKKVVPFNIPAHQIEFSLGSDWLPATIYEEFAREKYGVDNDYVLSYYGGEWHQPAYVFARNEKNRSAGVTSNIVDKTAYGHDLMLAAMNNKSVEFSKKTDEGMIYDKVAQQAAQTRIDEIRDEFVEWLKAKMSENETLREKIEKDYNEMFNNYVPKEIADEYMQKYLDGATHNFELYPHQKKAVIRGTTEPLLLAHEVGSGKTFTLISTAMEMRRLGTAKKPMIVVQNSTVGQFVSQAKELYPACKLLTVTEADRTREGRAAFYAKIKYNDWDLIIVPQSVFEMIPDSEERKQAFIQEKIDEKLAVLAQAQEANADSRAIKAMKDEIEALEYEREHGEPMPKKNSKKQAKKEAEARANTEAKAQKQMDRRTDEVSDFDDMGIDALLVDEAHAYKKLGFATNIKRGVKGVDASGSKRSAGLYLKSRSIFDRCGWKNVVFATGTPISNTAAEIWTFMKYLMPSEVMKSYHIFYFDDFVKNFGKIQTALEFATNGKFKESTRFASYGNVPELVRIWSSVSDTVLSKDAEAAKGKDGKGGKLSDKLPKMTGVDEGHPDGKPEEIFLPQSSELVGVMKFVRDELERFERMSGDEKKENSSIPLVMYGIAKRAAIDTRLVVEDGVDNPVSKTNKAVELILGDLKDTAKYNGTVAVFCDNYRRLDFNPKNGKKDLEGFNIFDDIKAKLVAAGVPESQIAIVRSGKGKLSDKAKEKLFAQVNAGEVRVIMGSTQTLGTGVNIQQRLHLAIHMDTPDRPMDVTQRNGRILRQGNLHKDWDLPVRVVRMGVEDSLDVTGYQRLDTKSRFINSIMNGKTFILNSRNVEFRTLEEEEDDMYSNPVAVLSGSQYALLKSKAERDLRKYQNKLQQHKQDQVYINSMLRWHTSLIASEQRSIANNEAKLEKVGEIFPAGKVTSVSVNGITGTNKERINEILKEQISQPIRVIMDRQRAAQYSNEEKRKFNLTINGTPVTLNVKVWSEYSYDYKVGESKRIVHGDYTFDCDEFGFNTVKATNAYALVDYFNEEVATGKVFSEDIAKSKQRIATWKSDDAEMRKREGVPFADQDKLDEAKAKVAEYTELMRKEMDEKEAKYKDIEAPDVKINLASANTSEDEAEDEDVEETHNREMTEEAETLDVSNPLVVAKAMSAVKRLQDRIGVPVRYVRGSDVKGHYTEGKNEVVINIGAHESIDDVVETYLHEAVAHFGLRELMGDEFDAFIDSVWNNATEGIRRRIRTMMSENGWDRAYATEEYIAELAQKTNYSKNERSLWRKIVDAVRNFINAISGRDNKITDDTIREILVNSFEHLENITKFDNTNESDNGQSSETDSSSGLDYGRTVGRSSFDSLVGRPEARSGIARTAEAGDTGGSTSTVRTAEEREELESRGINPDWDRRAFLSAIKSTAKENGVWLDKSFLDGAKEFSNHRKHGTSENDVYLSSDGKSVIKLNNLSYVKSARPYENMSALMDRLVAHNVLFPEVAYDVVGFMDNSAGRPAMVMTQPYIGDVVNATQEEINADLTRMGFVLDSMRPWSNMHEVWSNGKYELFDARPANVLKKSDGTLFYIDTIAHSVGFDGNGQTMFRTAYHGSAADFKKFDLSHVGEGEGAMAHGYGVYVAFTEQTGKDYAVALSRSKSGYRYEGLIPVTKSSEQVRINNILRRLSYMSIKDSIEEEISDAEWGLMWVKNNKPSRIDEFTEDVNFVKSIEPGDFVWHEADRNLYQTEIPEDTGSNYLDEKRLRTPEEAKELVAEIEAELVARGIDLGDEGDYMMSWNKLKDSMLASQFSDRFMYDGITLIFQGVEDLNVLDAKKAASEVFSSLGFVGIKYVGGRDGECAVIFNENDVDIVGHTHFRLREKPAPKKTGIGYKVFFRKNGKLYPPMVANPNGEDTPVGVWLDADAAPIAGESKTGRPQVKAGGKGTQGGSGQLAYRPGWHLGTIPYAIQFNRKDENGDKTLFPKDFVWAEVEYAADKDYQTEAEAEGINANGKYQHSLAGLKRLPEDGFYMYRTNPNPETDPWIITGAMKVNKVLTREEVDELVREAGREPQRVEGEVVRDRANVNKDRTPGESAYDYIMRAKRETERKYNGIARFSLVIERESEDMSAYYDAKNKAVVYYSNDNITTFDEVEDTFFHENWHAASDKYGLAKFFSSVVASLKQSGKNSEILTEIENEISSSRYYSGIEKEELCALVFADAMVNGHTEKLASLMKPEDKEVFYKVLKDIKYDSEQESKQRRVDTDEPQQGEMRRGTSVITGRGSADRESDQETRGRKELGSYGVTASLPAREAAASATAEKLGVKVNVVSRENMPRGHEFSLGTWSDGEIYICPENCADEDDVAMTVIHEAVGHNGLRKLVGNENMDNFCMDLFRNSTGDVRRAIIDYSRSHGYNFIEGTEEYLAHLSETMDFTEPERTFWDKVKDAVRNLISKIGINIPVDGRDLRWILWQSYNANKRGELANDVARAALAHKLGFTMSAERIRNNAQQIIRDRKLEDEKVDSAADIYNMSVSTLKARMHEIYVDQYDSVNRLVEAIEKSSGKAAKSFEDIRKALNQYSSKALETGMKWHRNFFTPMLDAVKACEMKAGCKESDIVRYVFLKHGLERNIEFAKRDARSYYKAIYDSAVNAIRDNDDLSKEEKDKKIEKEQSKFQKHLDSINNGTDSKYLEFRQQDYGGLTSLFSEYDPISAYNSNQESRERYEERVLASRHPMYETIEEIEAAAEKEVKQWEDKLGDTAENLWERINAATKETLKQQYDANMLTKSQYETVRDMFKYYVPMRGFAENTAEDMYSYYMSDQTSTFESALKRAEGRTTVADNPFSYIGHIYSSSNAANAKNEAKLTLYYFLSNRPDNDIATISDVWYERAGEEDGKDVYKPVYPEMTDDMTGPEAKAAYQRWEQEMKDKASRGEAFRGRKNLKLDSVIHITDQQAKSHVIKLKVGGEDKMIIINGNPRAAQAINGELNFDAKQSEITKWLTSALRLLSSLNTTYNPEFTVSNLQRDVLMSIMSASVEGNGREFIKNLKKATKVVSMNKAYNSGKLGDSLLEKDYREFRENGGMTGYSTVRSLEDFDREIDNYLGEDKNYFDKINDGIHGTFELLSRFSESVEQISRFAAYLTAKDQGKTVVDSISAAKEVTVNFNRKGSGKFISPAEAQSLLLKGRKMKDLGKVEQIQIKAESICASALSFIAMYGRGTIMFFNAGIQGINTIFNLYKKNGRKMAEWTGAYLMLGAMGAILHAMMDDDDDYLDMPDYERRTNLLIGANGFYFKWAMPQEMRAFYGLGDIIVNHALGRTPHKNIIGESLKTLMDISPINPTEGISQLFPSYATPIIEVIANKNFMGSKIYNEMKYLSEEEKKRIPAYKKALNGTGQIYVDVSKLLNKIGNPFPEEDAGWLNINPGIVEHLIEGYTGGAGTTIEKIMQFASSVAGNEPLMLRNTPMLRRMAVINDERSRNAHTTDLYYYYKAEAEHTSKKFKSLQNKGDTEGLQRLRENGDIDIMQIYNSYKGVMKFYDDQLKEDDDINRRRVLMQEQDQYRKEMIKEISEIK